MIPYDCRPERRPHPASTSITRVSESVRGASGQGPDGAATQAEDGAMNHPSYTERMLENRYRETKLPARPTTLDAVVQLCVWSSGVNCS